MGRECSVAALVVEILVKNDEPLVFGIDEAIERRCDEKIRARGIYCHPVPSSHSHFVKASGLRYAHFIARRHANKSGYRMIKFKPE